MKGKCSISLTMGACSPLVLFCVTCPCAPNPAANERQNVFGTGTKASAAQYFRFKSTTCVYFFICVYHLHLRSTHDVQTVSQVLIMKFSRRDTCTPCQNENHRETIQSVKSIGTLHCCSEDNDVSD